MEENPHKAPKADAAPAEVDVRTTEAKSRSLIRTIYVVVSLCCAGAVLAAKVNVVRNNPWCDPRWTPDFILFWGVRDTIGN